MVKLTEKCIKESGGKIEKVSCRLWTSFYDN